MLSASPATSQEAEQQILVINFDQALNESVAGRTIRERTTALQTELRREVAIQREALDNEDRELARLRDELDAVDFEARAREFEEKLAAFQEFEKGQAQAINDAFKAAFAKLDTEARAASREMLDEFNATMAVTHLVVIAHKTTDATDALVQALNERVTDIPLEVATVGENVSDEDAGATGTVEATTDTEAVEAEVATQGETAPETPDDDATTSE